MVKALGTAANDDQFLAREGCDTRLELSRIHESAFTQFLQLGAEWEGVKVVAHRAVLGWGSKKGGVLCRTSCSG